MLHSNNKSSNNFEGFVKFIKQNYKDSEKRLSNLDFLKIWPNPKIETWRLSRLGNLSRKIIIPKDYVSKVKIKKDELIKNSNTIYFYDGFFREDLSNFSKNDVEVSYNNVSCLEEIENLDQFNQILSHPTFVLSSSCVKNVIKFKFKKNFKSIMPFEVIYDGVSPKNTIHSIVIFEIGQNSNISIFENFKTKSVLTAPFEYTHLNENSKLNMIRLFNDDFETHNLFLSLNCLKQNSSLKSFSLIAGGKFTRSETFASLNEEGANLDLNCIYLAHNNQHHDFTTSIKHNAPCCNSSQIVRGVLNDNSTGVFQGKVTVEPFAQKTNANQMSKALLLSDKSISNSKPELEIFADDVVCSHGATVGNLEDDEIFYLQSRGIPVEQAKKILIEAFLHDTVQKSVDKDFFDLVFNETQKQFKRIL